MIAEMFLKSDQKEIAWKYLKRIDDVQTACERFVGIGEIPEAIAYARERKNSVALQRLKEM